MNTGAPTSVSNPQARISAAAKAEFYLLCVLLLVLPILEAPKTLALLLYLLVWTARRFSLEGLRRFRPDTVEIALLAMIAASAASTAVNWPYTGGNKGLMDTLRYAVLFGCIYRAGYSAVQQRTLAQALTWGLMIGLAVAVAELMTGRRSHLELHSAGVVTQSAVYVAIGFVLVFGMMMTRGSTTTKPAAARVPLGPWAAALACITLALMIMGSRGALAAVVAVLLLTALLLNRAKFWIGMGLAVVLAGTSLLLMVKLDIGGPVVAIIQERFAEKRLSRSNTERYEHVRIALAQIRQGGSPWLGIGPRNYHSIDLARLSFDPPLQLKSEKLNHAHNLFLTKLVEEGAIGLAAFLFFLAVAAQALIAAWWRNAWHDWRWFAALGAVAVPVIAGSFNTPFYQEHAMLAMAIMAIYLSARRQPGGPSSG